MLLVHCEVPLLGQLEEEIDLLRRVLLLRQAAYQLAWWLAFFVSVLLIIKFPDFIKLATSPKT